MLPIFDDGRLQLEAGAHLLQRSGLVVWNPVAGRFEPVDHEAFEASQAQFDPKFGRLICWILFSAGSELLAKGVCLLNKIELRKPQTNVPSPPTTPLSEWMHGVVDNNSKTSATNFGTMEDLTRKGGHLERLCRQRNASPDGTLRLRASFLYLQKAIRNRDAHAYVKGVRDPNFGIVEELFMAAINMLITWSPEPILALEHPQPDENSHTAIKDRIQQYQAVKRSTTND